MSQSVVRSENQPGHQEVFGTDRGTPQSGSLPSWAQRPGAFVADSRNGEESAGSTYMSADPEGRRFETLLVELSATFINLPADRVDSQIETALRRLVEFLGLDRGGLAEALVNHKQIVITHSYHAPGAPRLPRMILDEQLPWYARTIRQGETLRLSALPDDLPPEAESEREYCRREGLKAHVMIPLTAMGTVVGAIGFGSFHRCQEWSDDLIQRLRLVGEIFTNALARKRADEALQAKERALRQTRRSLRDLAAKLLRAQEEERRRIAREMHDDWTQRLAVLAIETTKLERQLGLSPPGRSQLQLIREGLVQLSEDVHDLSRQLHPSILDDLGLVEALRSECSSFSRREGIAVVYNPEPLPAAPAKDVAMCIYRVTQEALRNIARHAAVKEASVTLTATGSELVLRVEDKGAGFDPAHVRAQPGLGLASVEERVRLVGATVAITSAVGRGTTIVVRSPLTP